MATTTSNLGLTKAADGEAYSVTVVNQNLQKIDDAHHLNYAKVTTQTDANACTVPRDSMTLKCWEGEDVTLLTNRPSDLTTAGWPFLLEVKHMGFYSSQTLYVFSSNNTIPKIYYRQQGYTGGSIVWGSWNPMIGATIRNTLTGAASGITQNGYYVVDLPSRTVRVYCAARASRDILSTDVLANIPAPYRPAVTSNLVGLIVGNSQNSLAYFGFINVNGNITQAAGNTMREVLLVGEYSF